MPNEILRVFEIEDSESGRSLSVGGNVTIINPENVTPETARYVDILEVEVIYDGCKDCPIVMGALFHHHTISPKEDARANCTIKIPDQIIEDRAKIGPNPYYLAITDNGPFAQQVKVIQNGNSVSRTDVPCIACKKAKIRYYSDNGATVYP